MPKENSPQSLDSALTLRRVARQQRIVEWLGSAAAPLTSPELAQRLRVSVRTVERDLARLRESGVPLDAVPGVHGGSRLAGVAAPRPVRLTAPEIAALIASLAALGPSETDSAASAMSALIEALTTD
ncbi:MAG: HTH domain-containing protein [Rhodococcus sp. (in: high G+C Gram-positive bacteria)]|uniref:helix-turn-helix transcriptional regulator n=1 Tax=unclassified Rhodococcus (in: high G+C Gram-positive bacteria) TaxID=192944 RepID=UPI000A726CF2|nr:MULTISPECIES: HTH domain-containing protein [unclassified Rhodococcus (in: high G+C Gram-positive bacteria)]